VPLRSLPLRRFNSTRSTRPPRSAFVTADTSQTACVQNCTDKFLKHSERVGARFAEHNAGEWRERSWSYPNPSQHSTSNSLSRPIGGGYSNRERTLVVCFLTRPHPDVSLSYQSGSNILILNPHFDAPMSLPFA
jgi:hypothetical protein